MKDYKFFVVSYDLRDGGEKDYEAISEKLEELGARHILKSEWSVKLPDVWTCKSLIFMKLTFLNTVISKNVLFSKITF